MDDIKPANTPEQSGLGVPIRDISPPQQHSVTISEAGELSHEGDAPLLPKPPTPDPSPTKQLEVTEAPDEDKPTALPVVLDAPKTDNKDTESQSTDEKASLAAVANDNLAKKLDQTSDEKPVDTPPEPAKKRQRPVVAATVAILVAIILIGLVVFAYQKTESNQTYKAQPTSAKTTGDKTQASRSDVDATNKQIDTNLKKLDDSKDFPNTDVSSQTLGL